MKTFFPGTVAFLVLVVSVAAFQDSGPKPEGGNAPKKALSEGATASARTYSSLDLPEAGELLLPPGTVALVDADVAAAFALYETLSQRSVIPGSTLPKGKLSYRIEKALPRRELLQALDTFLAQNGITMICMGTNFMKAVAEGVAAREAAPEISGPPSVLPDSDSFVQYSIRLRHRAVNDAIPMLQPFSRLPNSLLTVPSMNTIVMRDYSANVRRMLKLLQNFDVPETGEVPVGPVPRPRRN
ncbi:MAG TPA: secretin N-terminal domain-containing protein [Verrucomicrobiae bacterium]|nr:secretin N-terminal domain-containing protein [Verrucomicrobiae bacterium]